MTTQGAFPTAGMALTQILVGEDPARARQFSPDVLGATLYREYGGISWLLTVLETWLLLITGSGPTADKTTVTFPPHDLDRVSHAAYVVLSAPGAVFLTPPVA